MKRLIPILVCVLSNACGKSDSGDDDKTGKPSTTAIGELSDSSAAGVTAFLKGFSYRDWATKQTVPVDSVAAHAGKTLTYFNDTAAAAAKAGQDPLPAGSLIVKDLFAADGTSLRGQALMARATADVGGDAWVWFEALGADLADPYYGLGLSTCTGCHASGVDFVRTPVP